MVRCLIPELFLCQTLTGSIHLRRNLRRTALYDRLQHLPLFPSDDGILFHAGSIGIRTRYRGAYREPDYPIRLFLFGTVRLKYLALVVIVTDLLFITSSNAGGHIAHLGGALAGLWFAASLSKGADITAWINKSLDAVTALFSFKPRKPKMKVHYGTERQKDYNYNARKKAQSDEIDRILDKLKKSGYESLTTEEKKSLFDASKR